MLPPEANSGQLAVDCSDAGRGGIGATTVAERVAAQPRLTSKAAAHGMLDLTQPS